MDSYNDMALMCGLMSRVNATVLIYNRIKDYIVVWGGGKQIGNIWNLKAQINSVGWEEADLTTETRQDHTIIIVYYLSTSLLAFQLHAFKNKPSHFVDHFRFVHPTIFKQAWLILLLNSFV